MNNFQKRKLDKIINEGYDFKFSEYISRGVDLFQINIGGFVSYTLIYVIIILGSNFIPSYGSLIGIILGPPLLVGYYIVANKLRKEESFEFGDFFLGFQILIPLIIANLIITIFTLVGLVAFIIPGIYLAVAYMFTQFFIVFHGCNFWEAMEASRQLITKNWWYLLGLLFVITLINLLGVLLIGIGLLVSIPISYCIIYAAFEDIYGLDVMEDEKSDLSYFR